MLIRATTDRDFPINICPSFSDSWIVVQVVIQCRRCRRFELRYVLLPLSHIALIILPNPLLHPHPPTKHVVSPSLDLHLQTRSPLPTYTTTPSLQCLECIPQFRPSPMSRCYR